VLRVLTDNAKVYRVGGCWSAVCTALGIRRRFTKPGRPWTNGKAERLNRTLLTEFAYNQPWTGNTQRLTALPAWVNAYNTERAHTALGRPPPDQPPHRRMTVSNVASHDTYSGRGCDVSAVLDFSVTSGHRCSAPGSRGRHPVGGLTRPGCWYRR